MSIRRDLGWSLADAAGYGLMAGVAELYLPAFALAVGVAPVLAGLVATAPLLAGGLLQVVAPRAIERTPSLRRWVAICHLVQALAFLPVIALAFGVGPAAPVVFASASVYWAAGMGSAAGWTPWMTRVVPARIRSRFFGRRQGLVQGAMLVGLIGAGVALQATGGARRVYAAIFALAMIARLVSAFAITRQGTTISRAPRPRVRMRTIPLLLRGTPRATLLGYLLAALAATSISGPFLTPYLFVQRHVSYAGFCAFTATIVIVKIVALPVFGRMIAKLGVRPVLAASALAIAPIPVMWTLASSLRWLIVAQVYAGVAWAGFELGMLMALFEAADDAERTTIQSAFSALQAIGTAGAGFVGGAILTSHGSGHLGYTWLFAVSAFARLASATLVVRNLPRVFIRLPFTLAARAWTLGVRPWGGTIIRPRGLPRDE